MIGETFNLSYHMINSGGKSQSYTSKCVILGHNVLICLSKLLGWRRWKVGLGESTWNVGLGESFNLSYLVIFKSQSYNSKYSILSHNVLICLSKFLGQQDKM